MPLPFTAKRSSARSGEGPAHESAAGIGRAAEKINSSYVARVLHLTLLAPDIVEPILEGRQPEEVALPKLMQPVPVEWKQQPAQRQSG